MEQIAFLTGGVSEQIKRTEAPLTDGAWHIVRLQVFADGRCGPAIDGRVVTVSEHTLPLTHPLRLHLAGQSVNTRMLIGALEMWQGERHELAWFSADSTADGMR